MKSSTLKRSNLSKEKMLLLEELAKHKQKPYDASPGVYVRPNKEKELDVLWQNFRVHQKQEKSPGVYLVTGFVTGVIATLIMTTLLSFSMRTTSSQEALVGPSTEKEKAKITFIPADNSSSNTASVAGGAETYTVQSGDTLAGIVIRFYGKYDTKKIEKIKIMNNMKSENSLRIGQKLIIPMN